jgi:hypothetical protein
MLTVVCYNILECERFSRRLAMDVTLPLDPTLGDALRALAAQQGVSIEEVGRRALATGIIALSRPIDRASIPVLGTLQLPLSANGTISLHSPLFLGGPQPQRALIELGPATSERDTHAL